MVEEMIIERDIDAAACSVCIRIEGGAADTDEALQIVKNDIGARGIYVQEYVRAANAYNYWHIRPWEWDGEARARLDDAVARKLAQRAWLRTEKQDA